MLTSGLCGSPGTCPNHTLPYGMPGYGYRASYETQGAEGGRIGSSASFVSTSCCGALQLPFVTFGFGDFATYIETVPVSVPAPTGVSDLYFDKFLALKFCKVDVNLCSIFPTVLLVDNLDLLLTRL